MRKLNILLALSILFNVIQLRSQNIYIPDSNFKAYLISNSAINTNGDTSIQTDEAAGFLGKISCENLNINDLRGIGAFVKLTRLKCNSNKLRNLDLNSNINLDTLECYNNDLRYLDLRQNTNLKIVFCSFNKLASLDLGKNTNLSRLKCNNNKLTSLELSSNIKIDTIECYKNDLSSLDLIENTKLKIVFCSFNKLTSLDLRRNTNLTRLKCNNNKLTSLNLKQNVNLKITLCLLNKLTSFSLGKNLNWARLQCDNLNVSNENNRKLTQFYAHSNPKLSCIEVEDPSYSMMNWTHIDASITFSTNCGTINTTKVKPLLDIVAYPNPVNKVLTIDFKGIIERADIRVRDLRGQLILSKTVQNTSIVNLEINGAKGLYFVHIETEKNSLVFKVIKE
jgi:hypothetical protein